ncbi:hypothetical protein RM780_20405 [Streptomyces sp. DSM 44917]|uniref:Cardiolipin synthase N-terminal domain-containing protein n=1 Tax=Streptomyces boetiae TaxID=3075541 RepID=A0ABU2LCJ4_9ACTN|nr:hypothetical protein [Streptomyces sp. DSM 44917]MDT0309304.1 hypothetical protein [Streptomyces sp. DSM 44917]
MPTNSSLGLLAGVVVILAFFALLGYVVTVLRAAPGLPRVLVALGVLFGALPAVVYALFQALGGGA